MKTGLARNRVLEEVCIQCKASTSGTIIRKLSVFINSVRSSSGYHGLIEIRSAAAAAAPTFSNFSNPSDSKVKVKVKGPNMCYIF